MTPSSAHPDRERAWANAPASTIASGYTFANPLAWFILLEALLVLALFVSPGAALLLATAILAVLCLAGFPEWPLGLFLTGNVLVMVIFDALKPPIPAPTAIAFAALAAGSVASTLIRGPFPSRLHLGPTFRLSLALALILLFALTYSPRVSAGAQKLAFYLLFNVSLVALPPLLLHSFDQIGRILIVTFVLGAILAAYSAVLAAHTPSYIRLSPSESVNAIWLARSLGYSAIALIYLYARWKNALVRMGLAAFFVLFLYVMGRTASRAPLIGLFGIVLLWILLFPGFSTRTRLVALGSAAIGAVTFLAYSAAQVTHRLTIPVAQEASTAFRILGWYYAVKLFVESPLLGVGTGGFFLPLPYLPLRYAHNLFLELASETGVIGLTIGAIFVLVSLKFSLKVYREAKYARNTPTVTVAMTSLSILLYAVWNSLFSGDIPSNEIVWLGAGLVWAVWRLLNEGANGTQETLRT